MKTSILALFTLLVVGCANPGSSYASKHPELSAAQRQILTTGKIPRGFDVAGMTREQVKMAMGRDPDTFDKINGEDAWIYVSKESIATTPVEDVSPKPSSGRHGKKRSTETNHSGAGKEREVKTTVFFMKKQATHAEISEEHQ